MGGIFGILSLTTGIYLDVKMLARVSAAKKEKV
jgi:hypothetical protein